MKKIIMVLIIMLLLLGVTGCNRQIIDLEYTFDKAVCVVGDEKLELKIRKWLDYEGDQIQIITKDNKTYLLSMHNCYLVKE